MTPKLCTSSVSIGVLHQAIAQELHGHVREAAESPHANYVLQKERPAAATSFASRHTRRDVTWSGAGRRAEDGAESEVFCFKDGVKYTVMV